MLTYFKKDPHYKNLRTLHLKENAEKSEKSSG